MKFKKLFIALATISFLVLPGIASAARTDALWDYIQGGNYTKPNGSANGTDILIYGINHYLNFGTLTGFNGYGIRDNAGTIECKNSGGSWAACAGGGGGSGTVTSIDVSGGTTGLTTSGGPITTSGTITLAGLLNISSGGTGTSTSPGYGKILVGNLAGNGYDYVATSTFGGNGSITQVNTTYPVQGGPITTTGTLSLAFGTTTSNIWAGIQTFTNSPVFSTLGAGTVNSTSSGTLYNTATSSLIVSSPLTVTGTFGSLIGGTNSTINCQGASGSQAGCLSATDWTTFNGKQAAGNYITALTGDVTASGPGSVAATIANNAVTYAKFQQVAANSLVGNPTGTTGNAQAIATSSLNLQPQTLLLPKGNFLVGNDAGVAQATSTIFITSLGAIGINTTVPAAVFDVKGTSTTATGQIADFWKSDGTNVVRIRNDGNVGIGTTSPFSPLSVSTPAQQSGTLPLFTVASTTNAAIFSVNGNSNVALGNQTSNGGGIYINRQSSSLPAGLITPNQAITIIGDGVTNPNADGADRIIGVYVRGNTANFLGSRFDGTIASPTGVLVNEAIANYGANVYDGTAFRAQANFLFSADDNIDATNRGTRFDLQLTAASTTGRQTVFRVAGNGGTAIGATYAATQSNLIPSAGLIVQGNVGIGTTSPYAQLSLGGGNLVLGAATAGGTPGDLYLPKLGIAAGSFLAVDAFGKVIATTSPSGGGSGTVTSVATNNGITGGTITTTGTIGLAAIAANSVLGNITGASAVPSAIATSSLFLNASASNTGLLTSTDWTTFNNKGNGTVTSVAASVPSFLSISGSPITTSGTLAISYSGTALPIANGGTGVTTFTSSQLLYGNGTAALSSIATTSATLGLGLSGILTTLNSGGTQSLSIATSSLYTGTTGQSIYFSGTNTLTATSSLFFGAQGNIGIGTTTPTSLFTVAANTLGGLLITTWTNITNAFSITNALGANVFNIDTTASNPFLGVGTTTPWGTISAVGNGTSPLLALATSTNQGFPNFEVAPTGHVVTSGVKPTVSSCGTTNLLSGNDQAGSISFTGTLVTACTITFATPVPSGQTLGCQVSDNSTAGFASVTATSTTAATFGISTGLASGAFFYHCDRWQ